MPLTKTASISGSHADTAVTISEADHSAIQSIGGANTVLYAVQIDCTQNTAEKVYLELYNNATPTPGTTEPDMRLPAQPGRVTSYQFPAPYTFATALSSAITRTLGSAVGPTGTVAVKMETTTP